MMWAIRIVQKPSGICQSPQYMLRNSASSEEPRTTSGVAIGRKISRFVVERPRKRWRTSAKEISVPRMVPTIVANSAIDALTPTDRQIVGSSQMFVQASRENSFQRVFVPARRAC